MTLPKLSFARCLSALLACGILCFLVAASGTLPVAVVHASPIVPCGSGVFPCTLGPNLELVSLTGDLFSGTGPCSGGTLSIDTSASDPGLVITGIPTPCSGMSATQSATLSFVALNGFEIDDLSGAATCGVTGGNSLVLTLNSLTITCPTESGTTELTTETTFSPVTGLTEVLTLTNTQNGTGTSSLSAASFHISLVQTPEPDSLALLCVGLLAFAGIARGRLRQIN